MCQAADRIGQTLAVLGDEATGQVRCSGNRDLLSEHGANGELETVPSAGHAQPGRALRV